MCAINRQYDQFHMMAPETRHEAPSLRLKRFVKLNASLVAGGIAGAVSRTIVSPFERAKILLQLQGPEAQKAYQGMLPTIWKMYIDEGWRGWFRGNLLNCIRIVPYSAVQFAVFEECKLLLISYKPEHRQVLTDYDRLLAGSVGGIASVLATYPLDLVRARITVQTASLKRLNKGKVVKAPSVWQTLNGVYKNEGGVLALYRGIVPTTLGVAPYVALNFALYENLREMMNESSYDFSNPLWKLGAGAVSSFVSGVLIYPLDLLRKRYQVASMAGGELGFQYKRVAHALVTIFQQEGFLGAYKGLTANIYKIVPSMAVSWLCYDSLKESIARWCATGARGSPTMEKCPVGMYLGANGYRKPLLLRENESAANRLCKLTYKTLSSSGTDMIKTTRGVGKKASELGP